jgi:hypothetical protein
LNGNNMSNYFDTETPMLHEYLTSTIWYINIK